MSFGPVAEIFTAAEAGYRRERIRVGYRKAGTHRLPLLHPRRPAAAAGTRTSDAARR